jgi:hypothetical protein
MTVKSTVPAPHRIHTIRDHAYTLPVVRELPPRPPDPIGAQSLW